MTTPVFVSGNGPKATMSFVLPATLNARNAPNPGMALSRCEFCRQADMLSCVSEADAVPSLKRIL
jgi:hypothetical protein